MSALYNLARMMVASSGTGTISLGGAVSSFLTFAQAGANNGDVVTYAIEDGQYSNLGVFVPSGREIGRGTYSSSGTLTRDTVLASTNSNAKLSLSTNAQVFITAAAQDIIPAQRLITAAGGLPITASDRIINLNCAAPLSITVPLASSRRGVPLTFKDVGGTAAAQNITLNRTAPDTFDGITSLTISVNYEFITLIPANDGTTVGWSIE